MMVFPCMLFLVLPALQQSTPRPAAYWQAIAESGNALPEGESAYELIVELSGHLGSPDPVLRDNYAYSIPASWIYTQGLLEDEELRALIELWSDNLPIGIGDIGEDSVLLRSFSALDLSLLAAHDLRHSFLTEEDFAGLLEQALIYLEGERDLRGWVQGLGWCHSAAHTADLLKFLARSDHLTLDGQFMIFEGVANRMFDTDGFVFVHGEDDRFSQTILSLLSREDFESEAFAGFLELLGESSAWTRTGGGFQPVAYASQQNARNLLRALHVQLARVQAPGENLLLAREQVLATLGRI